MAKFVDVKKNTYFDSVTLMLLSSNLSEMNGVLEAAAMMGTDHNKALMIASGLLIEEQAITITPNDLVIGISAESQEELDLAIKSFIKLLNAKKQNPADNEMPRVKTIDSAVKTMGDPNFAVVSLPGRYAKTQTMKLMKRGMHVLLFSDNVSLEEENELKDYAVANNLLMMGPDCGTAIINGIALGFANVVRRGNIGLVAASGTGLQEVTCIIDALGGGISQALGTGGRDLKTSVGGKMMLLGLEMLDCDPDTSVIGIVSKPPDAMVMEKIFDAVERIAKPSVICFLGASAEDFAGRGGPVAETLEDVAWALVDIAQGKHSVKPIFSIPEQEIENIVSIELKKLGKGRKYIRGLYSGGTLCYESLLLLQKAGVDIYSNISTKKEYSLVNVNESIEHTLLDMGEDYFTDGMPHPMIDFRLRSERLKKETRDSQVAIILLDCVLGYGSHEDPAGALANAIKQARDSNGEQYITYITSVCGTNTDPQRRLEQEKKLHELGVIVMPTNAQAARLAAKIAIMLAKREEAKKC